jgi:hypothetical protein
MALADHIARQQKTEGDQPESLHKTPEQPQEEVSPGVKDPRPDLVDDSELWAALLELAGYRSGELFGALHGMRCMGTRIRRASKGYVYILRPDIDPTGCLAWETEEQYKEARDKWLKPHSEILKELLTGLWRAPSLLASLNT